MSISHRFPSTRLIPGSASNIPPEPDFKPAFKVESALLKYSARPKIILFLAALLIAIEALIFLPPKVLQVFEPEGRYSSLSLWDNPLRTTSIGKWGFQTVSDLGNDWSDQLARSLQSLSDDDLDKINQVDRDPPKDLRKKRQGRSSSLGECKAALEHQRRLSSIWSKCEETYNALQENGLLLPPSPSRYQTLLTSTFLHAGVLHLYMNLFVLLAVAPFVAMRFGAARFVIFFCLAGVAGMLTHGIWASVFQTKNQIVIGASGAIMGLVGVHWRVMLSRFKRTPIHNRPLEMTLWQYARRLVFTFLIFDLVILFTGGFISAQAHLGGLVFGLLTAPLFMYPQAEYRQTLRHGSWFNRLHS